MRYADEVSHAHKESVSSSCISNRDYGREDRPNVTKYNDVMNEGVRKVLF